MTAEPVRARGLRVTSLETGETFDLSDAVVDLAFEPAPDGGDDVPLATSLRSTHAFVAVEHPDPRLVALVSGDPWTEVWFRQAQQLAALRACAP